MLRILRVDCKCILRESCIRDIKRLEINSKNSVKSKEIWMAEECKGQIDLDPERDFAVTVMLKSVLPKNQKTTSTTHQFVGVNLPTCQNLALSSTNLASSSAILCLVQTTSNKISSQLFKVSSPWVRSGDTTRKR